MFFSIVDMFCACFTPLFIFQSLVPFNLHLDAVGKEFYSDTIKGGGGKLRVKL